MNARGSKGALAIVAVLAALLVPERLRASDPPHWFGARITSAELNCTNGCHRLHQAQGGTLTGYAANVNLCQSCHNPASTLAGGLPINNADKAVPGSRGSSHAFDADAANPAYGAQAPSNQEMSLRVMTGRVVCSTCHDQHSASSAMGGDSRISGPVKLTVLGSTGTLASGGTFTGGSGLWYLVEITALGTQTTARFRYSKDNGISWLPTNCSSSSLGPCLTASNVSVSLDQGVALTFGAGSYAKDERWELSASWPFLRAALDSGDNSSGSKFCRDCHRDWTMDHNATHTWTGTVRSHPVGVALNANGQAYDRVTPLDGNGAVQGGAGADANATNNLRLDGGRVQCLTCHGVHYTDSNTQSVDGP